LSDEDKKSTKKTTNDKQRGGYTKPGAVEDNEKRADPKFNIPEYKEPMNNPMIPNEQKRIFAENRQYKDGGQQGNPILNLQLYQPPKPKPDARKQMPNPAVFYPNYVPNPFDPVSYANYMQYAGYNMQPPPIYKEYNINIGGVSGSHIKTAMFFEDALPVKNVSGSFRSIGERQTMCESIRANLFTQGDGKDVPIENDTYNLLSHIKLMDMNPYNASRFSKNPYKGLPFGFLLYRSCYPMRHDMKQFDAVCAQNSTGVNVRIYRLTEGAYTVNKQDVTRASDYDEWRDVAFYNFVKEQILKKKVCPNFPFMYGYNISVNSNINFDDLKLIQDPDRGRTTDTALFNKTWGTSNQINNPGSVTQTTAQNTMDALRRINNRDRAMPANVMVPATGSNTNPGMMKQVVAVVRDPRTGLVTREITNMPSKEERAIMLNRYTGKALVCLTEACNYSLFGWAKKEYRADGNIKTMTNPGYHTKAVWESVIFQMLVALYVMQIKGLVINNFRVDRNVFIRDISTGGTVTNYWKYKVEGIEYYIPNYGYLVMIDSNYRDFDKPCSDDVAVDPKRERKLDGSFLEYCNLSQDDCIQKSFEMFKSAIDPNVFDQDFINDNGVKPPEDVLRLLTNMKNMADAKPSVNIAYYIRQFMTMFMNNRVGGPLTETEVNHVKRGAVKEFRKGQIVVMTDHDGIDKFVIHVRQKNDISRIITKDKLDPTTANFIEKEVPTSSLNEYSVVEPIRQNFKINESNLSEDSLLETYNVE
ncbi:hypothetical protein YASMINEVIRUS_538, partial [Yasminevirus sp. GU-2018]